MLNRARTQGQTEVLWADALQYFAHMLPALPLVQSGPPKSVLQSSVGNTKTMIKFAQIGEDCRTRLKR